MWMAWAVRHCQSVDGADTSRGTSLSYPPQVARPPLCYGIFASPGHMKAGHLAGVGTRHGVIRRVPERRRAGCAAEYQIPRLRTQSPLAALLPPRTLSRDATNARRFPIVSHAWPDRATPCYAWWRAAAAGLLRCAACAARAVGQAQSLAGDHWEECGQCQHKMPFIFPIRGHRHPFLQGEDVLEVWMIR